MLNTDSKLSFGNSYLKKNLETQYTFYKWNLVIRFLTKIPQRNDTMYKFIKLNFLNLF